MEGWLQLDYFKYIFGNRYDFNKKSFFFSLGLHQWHMEVPRLGLNQSRSCWPTPQPQQHQIQTLSVTYTTACGNARSLMHLTHWSVGIKPASSWILIGFLLSHNGNSLKSHLKTLHSCKIILGRWVWGF